MDHHVAQNGASTLLAQTQSQLPIPSLSAVLSTLLLPYQKSSFLTVYPLAVLAAPAALLRQQGRRVALTTNTRILSNQPGTKFT